MANGQIRARVRCTIELPAGTWGGGMVNMDQLVEQVRREGANRVAAAAKTQNGTIVGHPEVIFIVLSEGEMGLNLIENKPNPSY